MNQKGIADRVLLIGEVFRGRLKSEILDDALRDVRMGEARLGIETLCDQLYEHAVGIRSEEYNRIVTIAEELGADELRVRPLRELIIPETHQP